MKHIKIRSCHMGFIFTPKHMIWQRQQCVRIHSQIMHLQNWKCAMRCYAKCTSINIPYQETDDQYSDTSPSIRFHIYHLISRCSTHGRLTLTEKNCHKCKQDSDSEQSTKYIHQERASDDEDSHFEFSYKFLRPRNSEVGVSHSRNM